MLSMQLPLYVPCAHWSSVGSDVHGRCAAGHHGGNPTPGFCARCKAFAGPKLWQDAIVAETSPRQTVPIVRWLGINWYGVPWLKRIRLRCPIYLAARPGCGCIKALKDRVSHGD